MIISIEKNIKFDIEYSDIHKTSRNYKKITTTSV